MIGKLGFLIFSGLLSSVLPAGAASPSDNPLIESSIPKEGIELPLEPAELPTRSLDGATLTSDQKERDGGVANTDASQAQTGKPAVKSRRSAGKRVGSHISR